MRIVKDHFAATSGAQEVEYQVLLPADPREGERLPLVLHLHGAMSSSRSLELARPHYEELFREGEFPRAVIACPSTPTEGGFYLDWPDGGGAWETLISAEFPGHLAKTYGPFTGTALIGASMGGFGGLNVAFGDPERFAAVAAISPAVFPGETPQDVPEKNLPSVLGELHRAMGHGTGDAAAYTRNSVYGRARANAERIRRAALPILVDCGAADEFLLHEGAAYLHDVLKELAIPHEFRLVEGAGHVGPAAETRTKEAIRFIGAALRRRA
ncbi:alpha/beta hydrolase [Bailinhaonella thermotolerans]|uniref:Esterase n=1 Tax=Bailinhaonella thermotolerans TaxID=1070861 RepID=A0A3A4B3H4_9ACTN|nr:alpha/beta hydrolase-fold protein [Bailinhaonella thermotolerans]RJL35721.1 esterase [Bailinhaonella thermotolerans]